MLQRMVSRQCVSLRRLGGDRAGEVRFGRFVGNEGVTRAELLEGVCAGVAGRVAGLHVLAIEDTTELNYQAHAGRQKGLGVVGNGKDQGFFLHPLLAVDADGGACLGLAHLHLWARTEAASEGYRSLPIEAKESYRWIETVEIGKGRLAAAEKVTVVADREADIYEWLARVPDGRTEVLVRACRDRCLVSSGETLFVWLSALPVQGSYWLKVPARAGQRTAHDAHMQVRYSAVKLRRPQKCSDPDAPPEIALWAVEVSEDPATVADGEEPVHWRLLTTHPVESLEAACRCVGWYCLRWLIEQLFRTLKRQGLDIESSLVEGCEDLMKMACLATAAAVRVMQLVQGREGLTPRPAADVFGDSEIEVLKQLGPTLEGKTEKQKNPHPALSLAWAAWIIARLGGWKGYAKERKPGPVTMSRGLRAFTNLCLGWHLARGQKDVCIH